LNGGAGEANGTTAANRFATRIGPGRAQLISRNGHPFASFTELGKQISAALPNARAVIDGEICSLDRRGRPQFKNLMFHRGNPCFFAFDLLTYGKDLRTERLLDRKQELRRLLAKTFSPVSVAICGSRRWFWDCVIPAYL
jgi:ATP-dependent DNA ligase